MIRDFLREIDGFLCLTKAWVPPLQWEEDCFLMEEFSRVGAGEADLRSLNSCRMFLQEITLSDIVSLGGTKIEGWALGGAKVVNSRLRWPRQAKPGKRVRDAGNVF